MHLRRGLLFGVATVAISLTGCSGEQAKVYDISPIFPLSPDTCSKYNGEEGGDGGNGVPTCMVSKADCEEAASDWAQAMRADAIQFTCD